MRPLSPLSNRLGSCEKIRNFSGNRNICCGKPFRWNGPPMGCKMGKSGVFSRSSAPAPLSSLCRESSRAGTGCQPHFAGRFRGRFFSHGVTGGVDRWKGGNPPVFLTILPTWFPGTPEKISNPAKNPTRSVGFSSEKTRKTGPRAALFHFHTMLPPLTAPSCRVPAADSGRDCPGSWCVPCHRLSVFRPQFGTISPQKRPSPSPRQPAAMGKIFFAFCPHSPLFPPRRAEKTHRASRRSAF